MLKGFIFLCFLSFCLTKDLWEVNFDGYGIYQSLYRYKNIRNNRLMITGTKEGKTHMLVVNPDDGAFLSDEILAGNATYMYGVLNNEDNMYYISSIGGEVMFCIGYYDSQKKKSIEAKCIYDDMERFDVSLDMFIQDHNLVLEGNFGYSFDTHQRVVAFDINSFNQTTSVLLDAFTPFQGFKNELYGMFLGGPQIAMIDMDIGKLSKVWFIEDEDYMTYNLDSIVVPDEGNFYFGLKMKYGLVLRKEHYYIFKYGPDKKKIWKVALEETNGYVQDYNYFPEGDNLIVGVVLNTESYYYSIDKTSGNILWTSKTKDVCSHIESITVRGETYIYSQCSDKGYIIELKNGKTIQNITFEKQSFTGPFFDDEGFIYCTVMYGNSKCKKVSYDF